MIWFVNSKKLRHHNKKPALILSNGRFFVAVCQNYCVVVKEYCVEEAVFAAASAEETA